jgi:hypothetical protein
VRLAGGLSGAESDVVRSLAQRQALLDIQQSPIYGIGFDHLTEATEVHLQLLASGGVIALAGYLIYWATALRAGFTARYVDPELASALTASALSFLVLNFIENQVADAYLYVPVAILTGLAVRREAARIAPGAPSPLATNPPVPLAWRRSSS